MELLKMISKGLVIVVLITNLKFTLYFFTSKDNFIIQIIYNFVNQIDI